MLCGSRLSLTALASAGSTDAPLLYHLEGADLWVGVVGLVLRLTDRDDQGLVALSDDIEVFPLNADCLYLSGHRENMVPDVVIDYAAIGADLSSLVTGYSSSSFDGGSPYRSKASSTVVI